MKKLLLSIVCCLACIIPSFAQKGVPAVGVNLGVAPSLEDYKFTNFGIGLKFQYGITDPLRGEAEFTYWCQSNEVSAFELAVNFHYLFDVAKNFQMYPIVGMGYGQPRIDLDGDGNISFDRFLFNVGVGGEYAFTSNIVGTAEIKYQYMKDFSRLPITVGVAYKF